MPDHVDAGLLALFTIHLAVFLRLSLKHRQYRHMVATVTFALLVLVFCLRLWAPEWALAGIALHRWLRWTAWASAALSLVLLLVRRLRPPDA